MATHRRQRGRKLILKLLLDRFTAAILLSVLAPLLLVLGILVWLNIGWPIMFSQLRTGRYGRAFPMLRFSTTRPAIDARGRLLPEAERLTSLGRFLRSTGLDELPELWNVWCGDLSLVGPRALQVEYLSRYSREQARRHEVLPGITGWSQVNGRNAAGWESKLELDVWYVDHWSLWLDFKILCLTLWAVVRHQGISRCDGPGMPEFRGSAKSESFDNIT